LVCSTILRSVAATSCGSIDGSSNGDQYIFVERAERPKSSESEPKQSRNEFAFHEMGLLNRGVFDAWHRHGQGYHHVKRLPIFGDGLDVELPVLPMKQAGFSKPESPA
jgi:hypothetical protein